MGKEHTDILNGFSNPSISCASFTLKREFGSENAIMDGLFDTDTLKSSSRIKPWILYERGIDNQDESDLERQQLDTSQSWIPTAQESGAVHKNKLAGEKFLPEDTCAANLQEAPLFFPSEEEFKDPLKYIASIRPTAEKYGICRIVPPSRGPSSANKKAWENVKFATYVQCINEIKTRYAKRKLSGCGVCSGRKRKRTCHPGGDGHGGDECCKLGCDKFAPGPEHTLKSFMKYADDFKSQYFGDKLDSTVHGIEDEYWRIVETITKKVDVLCVSKPGKPFEWFEHVTSGWNLSDLPRLAGSLLQFESHDAWVHWLHVGMCFSSICWKVEAHHLYSMHYLHLGAPKIWYAISGRHRFKFEEVLKQQFPELVEHPSLISELVSQLSPLVLKSGGIPISRCIQQPGEFVVIFPAVYYSGVDCGFSCTEVSKFAPIDWLPYGQYAVELYQELSMKTLLSHDKLLIGAASAAIRAQWEISLQWSTTPENLMWQNSCGMDGILTKAVKSRVRWERMRRECLCGSAVWEKMEGDFSAGGKRECCICCYDLFFSAVGCSCSPERYACLNHAKQTCSCQWSSRRFLFRYGGREMDDLVEALQGKLSTAYRWAKDHLGLTLSSTRLKKGDRLC